MNVGSYILFIGYYKNEKRYLVKGWLRVGEKISYAEAHDRFATRDNVIIRKPTDISQPHLRQAVWPAAGFKDTELGV